MQEIQGLLVGRPGLFQDGRTTVCGLGPPRGHHWLAAHLVPGVGVVLRVPPKDISHLCRPHGLRRQHQQVFLVPVRGGPLCVEPHRPVS